MAKCTHEYSRHNKSNYCGDCGAFLRATLESLRVQYPQVSGVIELKPDHRYVIQLSRAVAKEDLIRLQNQLATLFPSNLFIVGLDAKVFELPD